jgi:hypothetical protein
MHNPHALAQVRATLWNVHTFSLITSLAHSTGVCKTKTWYQRLTNLYVHYIYTCFQWLTNLYGSLHHTLLSACKTKMAHQPICTTTNGVQIRDITFPSPLFMHCPQCIIYTYTYKTSKIFKNMRILCSHSILALPSCILRTVPCPLDLYQLHGSILELLDFLDPI